MYPFSNYSLIFVSLVHHMVCLHGGVFLHHHLDYFTVCYANQMLEKIDFSNASVFIFCLSRVRVRESWALRSSFLSLFFTWQDKYYDDIDKVTFKFKWVKEQIRLHLRQFHSSIHSFIHFSCRASCLFFHVCALSGICFSFFYICVSVCVWYSYLNVNAHLDLLLNGVKNRADDHVILT